MQQVRVGAYVMKQKLKGNKRYPLVLMLEPLFKCNLACAGCGKIDYPKPILDKRLSPQECFRRRRRVRRSDRGHPRW
jgi:MoaA/NifB/PqqE/SkfB family radical SAM enzyme